MIVWNQNEINKIVLIIKNKSLYSSLFLYFKRTVDANTQEL